MILEKKTCQMNAVTRQRTLRNPGRGGEVVAPVRGALVFQTYNGLAAACPMQSPPFLNRQSNTQALKRGLGEILSA